MSLSVIVIGAGSTGSAVAHDLALRGLKVIVLERGEIASGTTGRNHCLLHSGGRYCVNDQESAVECIDENKILRKIMPDCMELNGGLFVAITDSDMAFKQRFIEGCQACHIPYKEMAGDEARHLEPYLSPNVRAAVSVPDGVFEPMRMCMSFLATAKKNGALVRPYTEVKGLLMEGQRVVGIHAWDRVVNKEYDLRADMVVNATGAWAGHIAEMAGVDVPVVPAPGVMVSTTGRFAQRVINRLNKSSDGDIVVPQRATSIVGTSSWTVDDADLIGIPADHVRQMIDSGSQMIPALRNVKPRGIFAVARPLIGRKGEDERDIARTFECFDHGKSDGVEGIVTISGGKTTTARAMAEKTVDIVCSKLGVDVPCATKETILLSYRQYYAL